MQAQILELIRRLRRDFGSAIVLITHDMGVVAEIADRVMVMYAGRVVERGAKRGVFRQAAAPLHVGAARFDPARSTGPSRGAWPPSPACRRRCSRCRRAARSRPRCPHIFPACSEDPALTERSAPGHFDRCPLVPEAKSRCATRPSIPELAS